MVCNFSTRMYNYLVRLDAYIYQLPLILTELLQHNLINVSYLTACYLYQVMMTLHFLNDVANDAESTQKSKITSWYTVYRRKWAYRLKTAFPEPYPLQKRSLSAKNKLSHRQWHQKERKIISSIN